MAFEPGLMVKPTEVLVLAGILLILTCSSSTLYYSLHVYICSGYVAAIRRPVVVAMSFWTVNVFVLFCLFCPCSVFVCEVAFVRLFL